MSYDPAEKFNQPVDGIEVVSRVSGPRTLLTAEAMRNAAARIAVGEDREAVILELAFQEVELLEDLKDDELDRALGGPDAMRFLHLPGQHEQKSHGYDQSNEGSAPKDGTSDITLLSREEMIKSFREKAAVNELVGGRGVSWNPDDALLDLAPLSVGDRLVALALVGDPEAKVWTHKDSLAYGTAARAAYAKSQEAFKKQAKDEGWSDEKILAEGIARGLIALEKSEEFRGNTANTTDPFKGAFWKGLNAEERDRLETGYIAIVKGKQFTYPDVEKLIEAGWTEVELERFADKLQANGSSYVKFTAGYAIEGRHEEKYHTLDSAAGALAYFSKDHDNFQAKMFGEWTIAGGDKVIRSIAEKAYPPPEGTEYYKPTRPRLYSMEGDEPERQHWFSDRAVENLKITKAQTDAFYKAKKGVGDLDKTIELQRGIGGHVIAYTPGSMESWTSDSRTVDRFGKMMSKNDGNYSALRTTVRYRDLIWTHESHKGKPGLPPDKELKGKKEFVVIGNRVLNVQLDRRRDIPQRRRN